MAEARDRAGLGAGAWHAGLLLALADVKQTLAAVPEAQVVLGVVVVALALVEGDQVDALIAGVTFDGRHKGIRHESHHLGVVHLPIVTAAEDDGDAAGGLALRLVDDRVKAIDHLDIEGDFVGVGVGGVACYYSGAGCGRWAPRRTVMIRAMSPERPYGGDGRKAEQRAQSGRSLDGAANIRVALFGLRRSFDRPNKLASARCRLL